MLAFAALIALISPVAFVALCGGGKKDAAPKGGAAAGPAVQKNEIAATEVGECPKDTVADVKSSWGDGAPGAPPADKK